MTWLLLLAVAALLVFAVTLYNRLIQLRNRVNNAWSQIDVELRRRHDLIPQLVETVRGYAAHETETFNRLTAARGAALAAGDDPHRRGEAEGSLSTAFRSVFAVAEAYPQLQASAVFQQLQKELSHTESRLGFSRQFYNDTVMTFNTAVEQLPGKILAGPMGLRRRSYFELLEPGLRQAPTVSMPDSGKVD